MLVLIPAVLSKDDVMSLRAALDGAGSAWVDGRITAGHQGATVKHNQQLAEESTVARELGDRVLARLERHSRFIGAALPDRVYPPMFSRYSAGDAFGSHVDNAVRLVPGTHGRKLRTDLSATLFLSEPQDYDGGDLHIDDGDAAQSVKLAAGDLVLYPSTHLHRVEPVTRGVRLACFFWVQSMVRDLAQRRLLFELDEASQRLAATGADEAARARLLNCYHNLLRMWSTV